jgi:DNA-binding winged helix-turn-helix (wHTH) protein/tetratricopeptide (TPR) repeat protein
MTDGRPPDVRVFGAFRFDVRDERLFRGRTEVDLRRKPFVILRYLTAHPQRLVTQPELVEAVWGKNVVISESLLRTHVSDVRRALGEGLLETVVGRGYRFLLPVEAEAPEPKALVVRQVGMRRLPPNLVGRSSEINTLRQLFEGALDANRQVVFVTGDPGIGKTTVVDAFLSEVAAPGGALVASGSCIEHLGTPEAYLPVFKALGTLCRGDDSRHWVDLLARYAPTWLAQMPGLVADEDLQTLALRVQGANQARMLRELPEALDFIAAQQPLVLVLEDMHWADPATTDLLATLGGRRDPARVLVVVTCRPAELTKGDGLAKVIAELRARKLATTLNLESWSLATTADYIARRFPRAHFPEELAGTIRHMTGGSPLFAVAVVDDLESRGMIRSSEAGWELAASVADVASRRPDTVRQLIDIQIDRLAVNEQRIVEAASLVGVQFTAGAIAYALEAPADEVDAVCDALANEKRLLQFVTSEAWPDGSIQSHYAFSHALYRDTALARVSSATRRVWHRRIAQGLEAAYGTSAETISAELAGHFDEAQMASKAVRYYGVAGERAMRRFGRADSLAHFDRARTLIARLAASDEADRTELLVLRNIGPATIALRGFHDPHLEETFTRTADLARKLGEDRSLLDALLGLQRCYFMKADHRRVEQHEGEVQDILPRLADPIAAAEATVLSCAARLFRGQLARARGPLTEACDVLDAAERNTARVVSAPVVGLWAGHLIVLEWLSGAPDTARAVAGRLLARAESMRDPFFLLSALTLTALGHMWRREPEETFDMARRALEVSTDVGSPIWEGRAMSLYHWAATVLEPESAKTHYDALSTGLTTFLAAGPYGRTALTPCVVEVYARAGRVSEALREIEDALRFVEVTDERAWASELHRLRGELLKDSDLAEAERAMRNALEIAAAQGARSFELRAAMSLSRLHPGKKRSSAALKELRRIHSSFTEGLQTVDLLEARALLA